MQRRVMQWEWQSPAMAALLVYGALAAGTSSASEAPAQRLGTYTTEPMILSGQVMDALEVFGLERPDGTDMAQRQRVLVAGERVYGFIENPTNERALKTLSDGDAVRIEGRVVVEGNLIQIDSLTTIDRAEAALDSIRSRSATGVEIVGKNMCQCGLTMGDVKPDCSLGHLHHLVTADKLYTYLLDEGGRRPFETLDYHFRNVRISGKLYEDTFLKVENIAEID